ncbi:M24 family metallopeptidase [Streptococcus merionis]|uniref:X-Pro dipeptidase n=1 Tax=Streptococcus merionis TaxID=400065 RepID=A0A239SLT5_9STRE|nr:Xaa-Pro peptidase family protein [Streptococcus merionis]SNU86192.1 X-Pro dipeptidase [Streptococcus merionis]
MEKIHQIVAHLDSENAGLAIFSDPVSINYLTGFYSDPHERHLFLFVFRDREPLLFLPALETAGAKNKVPFEVIGYQDSENPWTKIADAIGQLSSNKVLAEFDSLNLTRYHGLRQAISADFADLTPLINRMKLIKSADEVAKLMYAGSFADKAMQIGFQAISLEKTETDIITEIEFGMKKAGVSKMSFETMVLSADNAANPHGHPGNNLIQNDALLLFDLGTENNGYMSDMTRTVAVGQPDQFKKDIYHLCLEAQLTAIDTIKPGVTAAEVDAAARNVIAKAGYGEYFNHRLGHGIGSSVHEFPSIMEGNDLVLEPGMAFSVEPGIYIPGKVGVRIEDCGVVTETGFDLFTQTPKELLYF